MTRTRMRSEARREQLLDQALQIVIDEGFPALTIERLAREAGLTRTPIYVQFGSLDGLVTALVERETELALAQLIGIEIPSEDVPLEVIAELVGLMLDLAASAPRSWHILLNPPESGPVELHARIAAGRAYVRAQAAALLREVAHEPNADLELSAHLALTAGEELLRLHLMDPDEYSKERLVRQAIFFVRGLIPAPA